MPPGTTSPAYTPVDTQPLVLPDRGEAPGRARGAGPLRREGPAKLTGTAMYADDLVFPGAWFGATIRVLRDRWPGLPAAQDVYPAYREVASLAVCR